MRSWSLRAHLLMLVLALALPLAVVVGLGIYLDVQQTMRRTQQTLHTLAETMVTNTGAKIAAARGTLERLAARPLVQKVNADACDPVLRDVHYLQPGYSNVVYTDLQGLAVCSAVAQPGGVAVNVGKAAFFKKFLQTKEFSVGQPHFGPITGKWVSVLSAPIRNNGQVVGAIHLPLDLAVFDPNIPAQLLPASSRYGFLDDSGVLIWRNVDPDNKIGTKIDTELARSVVRVRDGHLVGMGPDGVERFVSTVTMSETGWIAFVSVPAHEVYAEALQRAWLAGGSATLFIAVLLAIALAVARRIAVPVVDLERTAREVREGDWAARASVQGPRELAAVAQQFNAMVAAQQQNQEQLSAFLENSAVIAWLKDEDGRFVFISDNYLRRFGWRREAVLGHTDYDLWPKEHAEVFRRNDERLWESGHSMEVTEAARLPDGTLTWWLVNKFVFTGSDGRRLVGGLAVDVTQRELAQTDLRIAATMFEARESMLVTDPSGVILRVNQAFVDATGYTMQELVGQTPRLLKSGRHNEDFYRSMWSDLVHKGYWQGEVWDRRKDGSVFPKWLTISAVRGTDGHVTHYVGTHYDISERKAAEERIQELAFFDPLTHLPNRTLLMDRLRQAMSAGARSASYGAVLFIDLDNFKTLNDTLGHDTGDLLLKQVALRLADCVRVSDTVARLGGDEFVVMLTNLGEVLSEAAGQTEVVGRKILATLSQNYSLNGNTQRSTASVGVTMFLGQQTPLETVLRQADLAMYKSKASGRNTMGFFDPAMEAAVVERAALEADLRDALEQGQLSLYYQLQVHHAGQAIGAEALLRWKHPTRGMVAPSQFIPLAEETGLILPLGAWVLQVACQQLAAWAEHPVLSQLTLAVNVSVDQFREDGFVDSVINTLRTSGAVAQRLKLELTESLLVDNVQAVIEKMTALKAVGVGFALDDFGTGYSSLSYLKRMPLDQLKIDQSFVREVLSDANDASIARSIVALAQSLGLDVIAEGVESAAQRDFLGSVGCLSYQGYLFGRPVPLAEFEAAF